MAIAYPLIIPDEIGFAEIELQARNAVAISQSPFTFQTQTHTYPGQMWGASVTIPPVKKDLAEPWVAFLLALRGPSGTFLLGDPNNTSPRGTTTQATLTGSRNSTSPTITMEGTLLAGDYLQLGSGSSARLHKVVVNKAGNGTLEIWPALRDDYSSATVSLNNTKGVFRLTSSDQNWSINNTCSYGISFDCMEVV